MTFEEMAGMKWRQPNDATNPQNENAGNGGDLVKHVVYQTTLAHLTRHEPWSKQMRVRECHAGRGVYCVSDKNRSRVGQLFRPLDRDISLPLHDQQRGALSAIQTWPVQPPSDGDLCYAGSAVLNAWGLGCSKTTSTHLIELYEKASTTRSILRSVFDQLGPSLPSVRVAILPDPETGLDFDGEKHIEREIDGWSRQDLILLDPFAIWAEGENVPRRARYGRIFDRLAARGHDDRPSLIMFWTWGNNQVISRRDIYDPSGERIKNGYQAIRKALHNKGVRFIRVAWCWGIQFAMWVVVPDASLVPLREDIEVSYERLRNHLLSNRNNNRERLPDVLVTVDESVAATEDGQKGGE